MNEEKRYLNKDLIVQKAAVLANQAGALDRISIRLIADRLNVHEESILNHVTSLDELKNLLAIWAYKTLLLELRNAAVGKQGIDAAFAVCGAYIRFAQNQPVIVRFIMQADTHIREESRLGYAKLLKFFQLIVAASDVPPSKVGSATASFIAIVHGHAVLMISGPSATSVEHDQIYGLIVSLFEMSHA